MPTISMFYGILILMYFYDDKKHKMPHIHAEYGEYTASIAIKDGTVLNGSLPSNKMKLVQAWIEIHKENLLAKGHGKNKNHHKSCLFARLLRCINGHIFQYAPINAP